MVLDCRHEDASFVTLNDLENISILLDEDDDLEDEITHLLMKYFFVQVCKKTKQKQRKKSVIMF